LRIGEVSNLMSSSAMLAIDCEMVLCNDGTEAVVRVCVVDNKLKVVDYLNK
jgi:RNA exonuclease 1